MAIKKFKGKDLLKTQYYLRDNEMLEKRDDRYFLRGVPIPDIDQVEGITVQNPEIIDWDVINEEVGGRGSYDPETDTFTTVSLVTMYALDLERYGKRVVNCPLQLISYLIYEGMRSGVIITE